MEHETLTHYGVLGMKWGVRRYQNPDGSLTNAGKKRAANQAKSMTDEELQSKVKRMEMEKSYAKLSKERAGPSKTEKAKKVVDASSSMINQAKALNQEAMRRSQGYEKLDLSRMTDQELRERVNREYLERQYNDLFAPKTAVPKGQIYVSKTLDVGGAVLGLGGSALGIALAIKALKG